MDSPCRLLHEEKDRAPITYQEQQYGSVAPGTRLGRGRESSLNHDYSPILLEPINSSPSLPQSSSLWAKASSSMQMPRPDISSKAFPHDPPITAPISLVSFHSYVTSSGKPSLTTCFKVISLLLSASVVPKLICTLNSPGGFKTCASHSDCDLIGLGCSLGFGIKKKKISR